jgi:1-aminocyclopropane-1-carboxylate deaminase
MLRLDLIDAEISGNKWFKLKLNLENALKSGKKTILTFGGSSSNHLLATAAACRNLKLNSIGIVRGESGQDGYTMKHVEMLGMEIHRVKRDRYLLLQQNVSYLKDLFGEVYVIPEGGANQAGMEGCTEILEKVVGYDYILCAVGTGTTYAGLVKSAKPGQVIVGISVLKGKNCLPATVQSLLEECNFHIAIAGNEVLEHRYIDQHCIINNYAFGGYAKFHKELLQFIDQFYLEQNVPLDHIYTAKAAFAMQDLIARTKIPGGASVLIIHTGGLAGNHDFEDRYRSRVDAVRVGQSF